MLDRQTALAMARRHLKARGIANFSQEAAWLLSHALQIPPGRLYLAPEKKLTPAQSRRFRRLLRKRGRHYPLQYLLGSQFFCGLEILTPPGVLIPRPETEKLVEVASALIKKKKLRVPFVLDLGTGTGAIALALKKLFPRTQVLAIDSSARSVRTARANSRRLRLPLKISRGSLLHSLPKLGLAGRFDLIVSNPPYVTDREFHRLPRDVRCEPAAALRGGRDGLDFYRKLVPQAGVYLKDGGALMVETSPATWRGVKKLLKQSGYQDIRLTLDDNKNPRVLSAVASSPQKIPQLNPGQTVIFPTDTVYGLGAAYDDQKALKKIFCLKRRPLDKPLPVLIPDLSQLKRLGVRTTPRIKKYIRKHWPGPLTLVLVTKKKLSPLISRKGTIAVRQPGHLLALSLIKRAGKPLAATSANFSDQKAPASLKEIPAGILRRVDYVLDGGACPAGRPSAILDLTAASPRRLR